MKSIALSLSAVQTAVYPPARRAYTVTLGSPQRPAAGRGGTIGAGDWTALFGGVASGTAYSGGAYRRSNAHTFDIGDSFETGTTGAVRLSATASHGAWIARLEYASAHADHRATLPGLSETGWEPSVADVVNANLQLTLGWQHLLFRRSEGVIYDG